MQWNVQEICKSANVDCHFSLGDSAERMAPELEIALYRVVQESVNNIIKHAKATQVELSLERTPASLRLVISDNGIGIGDPDEFKSMSHGLAGMRHRVRSIGGTLKISGVPGKGTVIDVSVPLTSPAAA